MLRNVKYDSIDIVDPILSKEIDDSNEWLLGRIDDNSSDKDNILCLRMKT